MNSSFEYIYGPHSVLSCIKASKRKIYEIFIIKGNKNTKEIEALALKKKIQITYSDKNHLFSLLRTKNHQGVCARVSYLPELSLNNILDTTEKTYDFIVILDNIEDPRNFGAIVRSAFCLGADAVIIPEKRSSSPSPLVSKVSAGAIEYIDIVSVVNIAKALDELKKNGYWAAGLAAEGSINIGELDIAAPFCLVIGNEGSGIRKLVREKCDWLVNIPQGTLVSSLNASVAAGIGIYELVKKIKR